MDKQQIVESLRSGICNVRFVKVDGTMRILRCTLHPDYIPRGDANEDGDGPKRKRSPQYISENVLAVWDLDELHWKSFRISNVEKVDVLQVPRKMA